MHVILMNKNIKVLLADIDSNYIFTNIIEIYNINYAPLSVYNASINKPKNVLKSLRNWFRGRGIPSWRDDLKRLLVKLGVEYKEELLLKSYGLSLSDCYWLKEEESLVKWEDINFFDNDFEYLGYLEATYSDTTKSNISLQSPNNTTDGMLKKAWLIENGKRKLMKGTFTPSRQEPINEYIASQICIKLGIPCVNYQLSIYNSKLVSICDNILNGNEEIVTASDILESKQKSNNISYYGHYVKVLKEFGIEDVPGKLSDMFLVDYIMMNYDRHLKNFGVIRNVSTLKIEKVMPIFDTGQSLCCDKIYNELNFKDGYSKFFNNTNYKFSKLLKYIDLTRYDFNKIKDIPDILEEKLNEYKDYTDMSNERIIALVNGLKSRIDNLEKLKAKYIVNDK